MFAISLSVLDFFFFFIVYLYFFSLSINDSYFLLFKN